MLAPFGKREGLLNCFLCPSREHTLSEAEVGKQPAANGCTWTAGTFSPRIRGRLHRPGQTADQRPAAPNRAGLHYAKPPFLPLVLDGVDGVILLAEPVGLPELYILSSNRAITGRSPLVGRGSSPWATVMDRRRHSGPFRTACGRLPFLWFLKAAPPGWGDSGRLRWLPGRS